MYHDIVTETDNLSGFQNESAFQYKITETVFEEQVRALVGKDVIFSFDDGGVSFYTKAAPILEKYGLRGLFFISTNFIETPGFLSSEQIRELSKRGHRIGSHTHTHPSDITKLSCEDIKHEWRRSNEILTNILGERIIAASIPNGNSSTIVVEEAVHSGFTDIYTSQPTLKVEFSTNYKIIGRYVIHNRMTTQDVVNITTGKKAQIKMYIKWYILCIVKRVLGPLYKRIKSKIIS